jgi:hypothetical protein
VLTLQADAVNADVPNKEGEALIVGMYDECHSFLLELDMATQEE